MRKLVWLTLALLLLLSACQKVESSFTVLADGQVYHLRTAQRVPAEVLKQLKLTLSSDDSLLFLGAPVPSDQDLPDASGYTLIVRRAVAVTVDTPDGQKQIKSSALTVGQALAQAGFNLQVSDFIDPPAYTPIDDSPNSPALVVSYRPARDLTISVDGSSVAVRSAVSTVGAALAEAGLPLVGLDYSIPRESEPVPADGRIRVVRVSESISLAEQSIPFGTRTELSADLELDQQALLQGGEPGLKITRTRIRTEDGAQVSQVSEGESIVRPPQDRVLGIGTKIVIRTATVDGVNIEYWRALTLYATPYVPCVPGTNDCHYGTSSGTRVRKGEVAMVYPWYLLLAGEHVFVPGYGAATIEDNNGANTSAYWGTYWVDLGFAELGDIDWVNKYVTVYFLTPVPANISDLYVMP